MSIQQNLKNIQSQIPSHVTLVAVSKTKPNDMLMQAYEAGQGDFGENYVQELVDKYEQLPKDIRWHFIGHLQSNKVKYIAPFVYLIHGVESLKLLQEINKQAVKNNRVIKYLLQIYIASENTKFGLSFEECDALLDSKEFAELKNVQLTGLMAMASNTENQEQIKTEFLSLKNYANHLNEKGFPISVLSFGMSNDYQLAIACGSNMVRVGSLIFGERNYAK
jgi:pyridoxal phosphate enzyme (YggS family)